MRCWPSGGLKLATALYYDFGNQTEGATLINLLNLHISVEKRIET